MTTDHVRDPNQQSISAWNANAAFWDEHMGDGNDWHRQLVRPATDRLLAAEPGQRILDIGCGNGLFARHLAARGASVLGIDAAEGMIDRARAHRTDHDDRIEYRVLDCTDEAALLALGTDAFDGAIANMVLMDVADIVPLYRALARLLRPGAPFVCSVTHPAFNSGRFTLLVEQEEDGVELVTRYGVRVRDYLLPAVITGVALRGQPEPQPYFHRPLSLLLGPAFEAGLVLDALEEPAFSPGQRDERGGPGWRNQAHMPPVLVARLRRP